MGDFLSKLAKSITPYTAGEQPRDKKYIKLNTNENPYAPSPKVREILSGIDYEKLRLYSDPENIALKSALAKKYTLSPENVFVGNGSDEVLAFAFPAFFDRDGAGVAFPDITYSFYPVYCDLFGIKKITIPLLQDFTVDIDRFSDIKADGIVLANPNAPTGIAQDISAIRRITQKNHDKIVIIDEAYNAFSQSVSASTLIPEFDNLLVVNTFSKAYGLAGIRCGYALGSARLIDGLSRIKNSFNSYTVNTITESIAVSALTDETYYEKVVSDVIRTRDLTVCELEKLGFRVLPTSANFIFCSRGNECAERIYLDLKERGILVRHFKKPRIDNFLRVTLGTDIEMQTLIGVLKEIL